MIFRFDFNWNFKKVTFSLEFRDLFGNSIYLQTSIRTLELGSGILDNTSILMNDPPGFEGGMCQHVHERLISHMVDPVNKTSAGI